MRLLVFLLASLSACGDDTSAPPDGATGIDGSIDAPIDGFDGRDAAALLPVDPAFDEDYPPVGDGVVVTTLQETLRPRHGWEQYVTASGDVVVPLEEFGVLHPQAGEPHLIRDQLGFTDPAVASWSAGALDDAARSVMHSFIIGDPQFPDYESPVVAANNNVIGQSAYRPHGDLAPHVADVLIRSINLYHDAQPLDMVFVVGDLIENAQRNELEWFFTAINGGELSADSGDRDDPVPGPGNDTGDPFIAEGLRNSLPWLAVIGNHDVLPNGNFPAGLLEELNGDPMALTAISTRLAALGLTLPGVATSDQHPAILPRDQWASVTVDPDNFQIGQLPYANDAFVGMLSAGPIVGDPERAHVSACGMIAAALATGGTPVGHGWDADAQADCAAYEAENVTTAPGGWYTMDVVPGALRVIALALGPTEGGAEGILSRPPAGCTVGTEPCRDDVRYDQIAFLDAELARAEADNVAVVLMSHQSSGDLVTEPAIDFVRPLFMGDAQLEAIVARWFPTPVEPISAEQFRQRVAASPNVIAHIAGHNHINQVRAICADGSAASAEDARCAAGANGEIGYWEITTAAIIDFPHQGRFFEVVHVDGQLGAIYLTSLD
ncbi:MAG: hypothetical protein AAGF12_25895, partial [Myxococcota bacterium]